MGVEAQPLEERLSRLSSDDWVAEVASTAARAPAGGGGFTARCTWTVAGSVGHWGHIHQRRNRFSADLTVRPLDGAWKIKGLELLDEERL